MNAIHIGDCRQILESLPAESVHCCITSPPYWGLRSYLPDVVQLRDDAPPGVRAELASLGIYPTEDIAELFRCRV